ncbi:hypothetical protein HDU67_003252 [Dinochytrium kinnereticum]|nr:hypothetical protein HDU67_003252 [Dinochytrium kinnereticum]
MDSQDSKSVLDATADPSPAEMLSSADELHGMAANLASTIASIQEPLAEGVDVLVAHMIVLASKVRDENLELEDRIRNVEKEKEEVMGDLQLCKNKLVSFQDNLSSALSATSNAEVELDAKNSEVEQLRRENRQALRDRDEMEKRLADELASWEKIKADWASKETQYKEAVKSHAKVNKELKSETVLKDQYMNEALEEQQSAVLESSKAMMREKDMVIMKLQETLVKLEASSTDAKTRLTIAHDEITSLRNEIEELRVQLRSLMEDNELYQVLLRERTLNGEFKTKSVVMGGGGGFGYLEDEIAPPRASLSDELGGHEPTAESPTSKSKSQLAELEEQVKALKLFIDKILKRILEDDEFEAKVVSNGNTPVASPAIGSPSARRWPFTDSTPSLSAASPTHHRSASPNRTRSGLRPASPGPRRNESPLRSPMTPPRTPRMAADGKKKPLLTVSTTGVDGGAVGPLSAPAVRNPAHPKSGLAVDAAVAAASSASVANFPRRPSAAVAADGAPPLPPLDDDNEDEEPYVSPTFVLNSPAGTTATLQDDSGAAGVFRGFVRRISNAFASLTSPLPVEDGMKKELPAPVAEEGEVTPISVPETGVPPPPPTVAIAPPPLSEDVPPPPPSVEVAPEMKVESAAQ